MPTRNFSSFEAFFAANLHSDLRGMVLGRRRENWVMTQLDINNLSVQWGRAGSSVVVEGAAKPGGVSIFLPTLISSIEEALPGNSASFLVGALAPVVLESI